MWHNRALSVIYRIFITRVCVCLCVQLFKLCVCALACAHQEHTKTHAAMVTRLSLILVILGLYNESDFSPHVVEHITLLLVKSYKYIVKFTENINR